MKRNLLLLLFYLGVLPLFLTMRVHSKEETILSQPPAINKNIFDFTLGGTGLFVSINYSRLFIVKPDYLFNASLGIGTLPFVGGVSVPHQITYNLEIKSSFLEIGIGGTYWEGKSNASGYTEKIYSYQICPVIGWRKHFKNDIVFRAYANPLFHISGEYYFENYFILPYFGISIGYRF